MSARPHGRDHPLSKPDRWPAWVAFGLLALQAALWTTAWLSEAFGWCTERAKVHGPYSFGVERYLWMGLAPLALVLAGGLYNRAADRRDVRHTALLWWSNAPIPNLFYLAFGFDALVQVWRRTNMWEHMGYAYGFVCLAVCAHGLTIGWFAWLTMAEVWKGRRRVVVPIGACYLVPIIVGWTLFGIRGH